MADFGMGTTIVAAMFDEERRRRSRSATSATAAATAIRGDEILQLTRDHSLVSDAPHMAPWMTRGGGAAAAAQRHHARARHPGGRARRPPHRGDARAATSTSSAPTASRACERRADPRDRARRRPSLDEACTRAHRARELLRRHRQHHRRPRPRRAGSATTDAVVPSKSPTHARRIDPASSAHRAVDAKASTPCRGGRMLDTPHDALRSRRRSVQGTGRPAESERS